MLALQRGDGPAGHRQHLQRAQDTEGVVRVQPRGGRRVVLRQPRVQGGRPEGLGLGAQARTHIRIAGVRLEEAVQQGLDVEPGAADHDRDLAPLPQVRQRPAPPGHVGRRVEGFIGLHDIDQVVPHRRLLLRSGLGRSDVHVPVDLHRIGADDLAAERPGHLDPDGGLPGGRRPADHDDGRPVDFDRMRDARCGMRGGHLQSVWQRA